MFRAIALRFVRKIASFEQSQFFEFHTLATAQCVGFEEQMPLESFAFAQSQDKLTGKTRTFENSLLCKSHTPVYDLVSTPDEYTHWRILNHRVL